MLVSYVYFRVQHTTIIATLSKPLRLITDILELEDLFFLSQKYNRLYEL